VAAIKPTLRKLSPMLQENLRIRIFWGDIYKALKWGLSQCYEVCLECFDDLINNSTNEYSTKVSQDRKNNCDKKLKELNTSAK